MRYEGAIYRPPSEASSLILQITIGCSHNQCTFCSMFKDKDFRIRLLKDIYEDMANARSRYHIVKKIFLADADVMVLRTETLIQLLNQIRLVFPECKSVTSYTTAGDLLRKPIKEMEQLKEVGLTMVYMGVESGNDSILKETKKGTTGAELVRAGRLVKNAGILLSVTLISGLGGQAHSHDHA